MGAARLAERPLVDDGAALGRPESRVQKQARVSKWPQEKDTLREGGRVSIKMRTTDRRVDYALLRCRRLPVSKNGTMSGMNNALFFLFVSLPRWVASDMMEPSTANTSFFCTELSRVASFGACHLVLSEK